MSAEMVEVGSGSSADQRELGRISRGYLIDYGRREGVRLGIGSERVSHAVHEEIHDDTLGAFAQLTICIGGFVEEPAGFLVRADRAGGAFGHRGHTHWSGEVLAGILSCALLQFVP
jgi:hypothetical protein